MKNVQSQENQQIDQS